MKTALDQGFSVKDILAPYLTRAAQELGISAAEIDLTDPLWRQLVEQTDEKGERVRPNTQQILHLIRTDQRFGWDKTEGAVTQAAQFATELAHMFGAVG